MHSLFLLATLLEGDGLSGVFNSPQIVPVFGTIMILGIVVAAIWSGVRNREMQSQERLAAIAQGIPHTSAMELGVAPPTSPKADLVRQRNGARQAGLVLSFIGLGLGIFGLLLTWIVRERDVFVVAATGLIPLAIGVGLLIDARLKSRELERVSALQGSSDLRPLH